MDTKTNEEVVKEIVDKRGKVDIQTEMNDLFGNYNPEIQEVSDDFSFSTPSSDVMYANRKGTLLGKYENYIGGTNNEDRLARQQGFGEKVWNGVVKNTAKAGIYAAQTAVSLTYGVATAITEGRLSALFDNDLAYALDDGVTALETNFAHYYSDEEKSRSILGSLVTANFWFDQVGDGLAFIGGAILPSVILAPISGGASLAGVAPGVGRAVGTAAYKSAFKKALGKGLEKGLEKTAAEKAGMSALRAGVRRGAKFGEGIADTGRTAKYIAQSTFFEAGMEARHAMKNAMEEFSLTYQDENDGKLPGIEEISEYYKDVESMGMGVFWGNAALLSVTNIPMLGGAFGLNKIGLMSGAKESMNKFGNRIIGLGVRDAKKGGRELIKATKAQKALGTGYKVLKKPIAEGTEEMQQDVITKAGELYLASKYDDNADVISIAESYFSALGDTYTSKEGWGAFAVGAAVGFIGGVIPAGAGRLTRNRVDAFEGFGKTSYSAVSKQVEEAYGVVQQYETENFRKFNRANSVANLVDTGIPSDSDVITTMGYIQAAEKLKGFSDMRKDYFAAVDGIEIPADVRTDFGIESEEQVKKYKEGLKKNFDNQYDLYQKGVEFANGLGLENLNIQEGNIAEMKDAVTMMTMLGGENGTVANEYSAVIAKMTGETGTANAVKYQDEVISPRLKDTKKKYRRINDRIKAVTAEMIRVGNEVGTAETPEKQQELAKKQRLLVSKLSELREERDALAEIATDEIRNVSTKFGINKGQETLPDISEIIEQEDALEGFIKSLEVGGRKGDAVSLKYMLEQYKNHAIAAAELDIFTQRMLGDNYFKSDGGKKLMKSWLGDEYKDRKSFTDFVEKNEVAFEKVFGTYNLTSEQIAEDIENNKDLSDREKFKLEAVFRSRIAAESLRTSAFNASELITPTNEEVIPTDMDNVTRITAKSRTKVQGDTVTLGRKVTLDPTKSSPEQLRDYINEVSEQIDEIGGKPLGDQVKEIADKRKELRRLQADLVELDTTEGIEESVIEFGREQVQELESEIDELEAPLQFINSKDFETYSKLYKNKERTEDEQAQFEELSEQMDNWAHIAGTVTDGVQLTDVIDQLLNIEETETVKDSVTTEVTTEEVSQAEKSISTFNNYDVALNQSAVTAVRNKDGSMDVAGITKEGLADIVGEEIANKVGEHETKNTLIIPSDVILEINAQKRLVITDAIDGNPSVFSIVYETITGLDGTPQTRPLESDYIVDSTQEGVNDFGINEEALYAVKEGDELGFKVDDESEYNKNLLDEASEEMNLEVPLSEQEKDKLVKENTEERINSEESIKVTQKKIQEAVANGKATKRLEKKIADRKKVIEAQERAKVDKIKPKKPTQLSKETKEKLRNTLRIYVVNKEGQQVNVLKGIRPTSEQAENQTKEKFEALRAEITDNLEAIVSAYYAGESVEIASKVTAGRVFPGQLNLNLTQTETGVAREIKTFDKAMTDKIDDIGYVENGELKTKNGTKVDETLFLGKTIENSKGTEGKTPFVVFQRGGRRIAYPVKVSRKAPPVTSEQVTAVFNNQTLTDVQKAMEVNKLLAQAGFDLSESNNALVVLREGTLTEESIQAVTDKLSSKDYISSVDGWTSKQTTIEQDLSGNASIDIDTSRPFLSPKLQMDLSSIKVAEKVKTDVAKKKNSKTAVLGSDPRSRVRSKQAQDKMCD